MPERTHRRTTELRIELSDLGDWGATTLLAEYDPQPPVIRVNLRALERLQRECAGLRSDELRSLVELAVAHEYYHHCEALGIVERRATRRQREEAADAFARANVPLDANFAAFSLTPGGQWSRREAP